MQIIEKRIDREVKQILGIKRKYVKVKLVKQYWLEIVVEMKWVSLKDVEFEVNEISELLAIFTSISSKL